MKKTDDSKEMQKEQQEYLAKVLTKGILQRIRSQEALTEQQFVSILSMKKNSISDLR